MTHPARKRWFRFSLRTLFVVVTVFGCWLSYELRWVHQRRAFVAEKRELFRGMGFDTDFYAASNRVRAPGAMWLVGEYGVAKMFVVFEKGQRERDIQQAQRLFPEAVIVASFEREVKAANPAANGAPASAANPPRPSAPGTTP